jgi:ATP-dependent Lhr-like helicase
VTATSVDRLSPALQYQVVNTLGFRELRPVQLLTIDAVLDGDNCVVLAPTAGGKTEAAFFPLLSAIDTGDWQPVSVLYLSPIRALLNNQEERIARYAGLIGRRVFKWHGDTSHRARGPFARDPADILLTTPESLEAMMMSARVPTQRLFAGLRAVVIDEIHAFADDDRGAHLSAILERLGRLCGRDLQRIGLSATVGNPQEILGWLQGSSTRAQRLVSPPRPASDAAITVDHVGSLSNAAVVVERLHPGRKRLVFVDSRRRVEELGKELLARGVHTHVIHGSLAASARRDAERAFAEGQDCVIVATSALELGIDVGDLDHVLQIDAPSTVASFLQRMGRTGRRPGTTANCTFLTTDERATVHAAALVSLYRSGWVEPVRPHRAASHILAHQLMALSIQHEGVPRSDWWAWLSGASAFSELDAEGRAGVLRHMLEADILADHEGLLWLGARGERLYGRRNFGELYAVFDTPRLITALWETRELGTIDANFLQSLGDDKGPASFTLAGRPWRVTGIEWGRGVCHVAPAEDARSARWSGSPRFLGPELCRAIRSILVSDDHDMSWSKRARAAIDQAREEHAFLRGDPSPIVAGTDGLTWWNHAGGRANILLAQILEHALGGKVTARDASLTCKGEASRSEAGLRSVLRSLHEEGRPSGEDARVHAQGAARSRVSKFEPCLPETLLCDLLAARVVDVDGARAALAAFASS